MYIYSILKRRSELSPIFRMHNYFFCLFPLSSALLALRKTTAAMRGFVRHGNFLGLKFYMIGLVVEKA